MITVWVYDFRSHLSDLPEYEKIIKLQNQVLMDLKVDEEAKTTLKNFLKST